MKKKSDTVRYTAKQIKSKIARGEDRTDWGKANAMTGKKLEASIRADVDDVQGEPDWTQAINGRPCPERPYQYPHRSRRAGVVQGEWPRLPDAHEQRASRVRSIAQATGNHAIKLTAMPPTSDFTNAAARLSGLGPRPFAQTTKACFDETMPSTLSSGRYARVD